MPSQCEEVFVTTDRAPSEDLRPDGYYSGLQIRERWATGDRLGRKDRTARECPAINLPAGCSGHFRQRLDPRWNHVLRKAGKQVLPQRTRMDSAGIPCEEFAFCSDSCA